MHHFTTTNEDVSGACWPLLATEVDVVDDNDDDDARYHLGMCTQSGRRMHSIKSHHEWMMHLSPMIISNLSFIITKWRANQSGCQDLHIDRQGR